MHLVMAKPAQSYTIISLSIPNTFRVSAMMNVVGNIPFSAYEALRIIPRQHLSPDILPLFRFEIAKSVGVFSSDAHFLKIISAFFFHHFTDFFGKSVLIP